MTNQAKRSRYRQHVKSKAPYTRGRALIDVRTMLGPGGFVKYVPGVLQHFQVGELSAYGWFLMRGSSATSWRAAVADLRKNLDKRYAEAKGGV